MSGVVILWCYSQSIRKVQDELLEMNHMKDKSELAEQTKLKSRQMETQENQQAVDTES
jgi:hypothetical protein